jgi:hypothetical protein
MRNMYACLLRYRDPCIVVLKLSFFGVYYSRHKALQRSLAGGIPFRAAAEPPSDPLSADAHPIPRHAAHTGNRFESLAAVELLLRENGIQLASQLKPQDAALADATPDVTTARFAELFGGKPEHERPHSRVRNILCIDRVVQPYAPSAPGESGVIFFCPRDRSIRGQFPVFSHIPQHIATDKSLHGKEFSLSRCLLQSPQHQHNR